MEIFNSFNSFVDNNRLKNKFIKKTFSDMDTFTSEMFMKETMHILNKHSQKKKGKTLPVI